MWHILQYWQKHPKWLLSSEWVDMKYTQYSATIDSYTFRTLSHFVLSTGNYKFADFNHSYYKSYFHFRTINSLRGLRERERSYRIMTYFNPEFSVNTNAAAQLYLMLSLSLFLSHFYTDFCIVELSSSLSLYNSLSHPIYLSQRRQIIYLDSSNNHHKTYRIYTIHILATLLHTYIHRYHFPYHILSHKLIIIWILFCFRLIFIPCLDGCIVYKANVMLTKYELFRVPNPKKKNHAKWNVAKVQQ